MWHGVSNWFGITKDEDLEYVIPNHKKFGCNLFTDADLFEGYQSAITGCSGEELDYQQLLLADESRYFYDSEEIPFCDIVTNRLSESINSTVLCVVTDQDKYESDGNKGVFVTTKLSSDEDNFSEVAVEILKSATEGILEDIEGSADITLTVNDVKCCLAELNSTIPGIHKEITGSSFVFLAQVTDKLNANPDCIERVAFQFKDPDGETTEFLEAERTDGTDDMYDLEYTKLTYEGGWEWRVNVTDYSGDELLLLSDWMAFNVTAVSE